MALSDSLMRGLTVEELIRRLWIDEAYEVPAVRVLVEKLWEREDLIREAARQEAQAIYTEQDERIEAATGNLERVLDQVTVDVQSLAATSDPLAQRASQQLLRVVDQIGSIIDDLREGLMRPSAQSSASPANDHGIAKPELHGTDVEARSLDEDALGATMARALEAQDIAAFQVALCCAAVSEIKSVGSKSFAERCGMGERGVYKVLHEGKSPAFRSIVAILGAAGYRLEVKKQ